METIISNEVPDGEIWFFPRKIGRTRVLRSMADGGVEVITRAIIPPVHKLNGIAPDLTGWIMRWAGDQ